MVGSHSTHGNINFSPNEDSNVVQGPVIKDTLKSYRCCTEKWGDNKHWTCPALSREFLNKRISKCCDWRLLTTGPVACPAMTHVERTASVTQWGIPRRDPLTYYDGCLTVSRQFLLVSNIWLSVHSQLESFDKNHYQCNLSLWLVTLDWNVMQTISTPITRLMICHQVFHCYALCVEMALSNWSKTS